MLSFIKRHIFIILIFIFTLSVTFLTFLTFIGKSFILISEINLNYLLYINIGLLLFFFIIIFKEISSSIKNNINVRGSIANRKYIVFFSLFTLIPSLLISIFSLFLFSFALEKYFDSKITLAVNNSYELAKNYINEKRNKIESDIVLVSFDLNKNIKIFKRNINLLQNFLNTQRYLRNLDQIHIIDKDQNILFSSSDTEYLPVEKRAIEMVLNDDKPLKIINAFENKSAAIIKIPSINNAFLYVVKFLDQDISNYLKESQEAINFYYTVEDQRTGIKFSFALIYIIIVTLLLFLSIIVAIRFSSRFFISINNLISASKDIAEGNLNTKVPNITADKEIELLNKNFNSMINQLQAQQERLVISERHEAWEHVARKLAHEIKNPLTPIQLTIDNLKSKYEKYIDISDKEKYDKNLNTILSQIKQIENLVNEFSDFARMPKPMFRVNNLVDLVNTNIELLKKTDVSIDINLLYSKNEDLNLSCDNEQISRVIFNLVKNSIESIQEKAIKIGNFNKKISIEIKRIKNYIAINIFDNGIGFPNKNTKELIKPYYTTKEKGSGLGLSIVNKIINDHNGVIEFNSINTGTNIVINLPIK
ncbi:ATP-binding protein [Candidatus Pelagibacter sp.]|nr:ATP-binding protein [Candidatus Pelagibacter sp.]|tara:strand:- start:354 stop:2129 length:1776 start_codon:yes stop_codon:yes gene_type:complete